MASHTSVSNGVRRASVVADAHHRVAGARHRPFVLLALALALGPLVSGCFDGTYCQSGPKYGTQCYSVQQQGPGNMPPTGNGSVYPLATNSRRGAPNGQKP